ncbi:hypothetical protein AYL99_12000 [Fonsecaea erecta]|uniref:Uncharacterized protein n=1 Tax=Fonsecaea erecta TaxID=1367422 RepID=A0A178Z291_9EURO|nr:hypothetical protein AYL99_12000 [Fonsecaea erecta]OAP53814.1 hypothetical protein AYL99_12000 [Fonsecaea erecta]
MQEAMMHTPTKRVGALRRSPISSAFALLCFALYIDVERTGTCALEGDTGEALERSRWHHHCCPSALEERNELASCKGRKLAASAAAIDVQAKRLEQTFKLCLEEIRPNPLAAKSLIALYAFGSHSLEAQLASEQSISHNILSQATERVSTTLRFADELHFWEAALPFPPQARPSYASVLDQPCRCYVLLTDTPRLVPPSRSKLPTSLAVDFQDGDGKYTSYDVN